VNEPGGATQTPGADAPTPAPSQPRGDHGTVTELTLEVPVVAVSVLEDRAVVTRRGQLPALTGQLRVRIPEVSPLLVDKSLRAASPGVRVLDLRCVRGVARWRGEDGGGDAAIQQANMARAQQQLDEAKAAAAAARAAQGHHAELRRAELRELALAAASGAAVTEAATVLAAGDDAARLVAAERVDADALVREREQALRDAQRLAGQAVERAGQAAAHLELDCTSDGAAAELTIEYMVPAAAWRPFHRAELEGQALRWEQGACLWQRSHEDWVDVELRLSAERPSLGVEPPPLTDDLLDVRGKPSAVVAVMREQELEQLAPGEPTPPGGHAVVVGIDDGGLGLALRTPARCTVRSDGRPHRVALHSFAADAEVALLAIPLHSPLCHVRARFTVPAATPILAGPVDLLRSSGFIGRGAVELVNPGERAELGFGSEAEVRVHREQREEAEEGWSLTGAQSKLVRVVIRLSNLGSQPREVTVCDRVPVSEIEQVVVTVSGPEAFLLERERRPGEEAIEQITARTIDAHGLVTWQVPLPPRSRAAVTLEYRVKTQRGVATG
jgi:uncharacterized protein (TIGR02231 family)